LDLANEEHGQKVNLLTGYSKFRTIFSKPTEMIAVSKLIVGFCQLGAAD
jgi:hypothetical protein